MQSTPAAAHPVHASSFSREKYLVFSWAHERFGVRMRLIREVIVHPDIHPAPAEATDLDVAETICTSDGPVPVINLTGEAYSPGGVRVVLIEPADATSILGLLCDGQVEVLDLQFATVSLSAFGACPIPTQFVEGVWGNPDRPVFLLHTERIIAALRNVASDGFQPIDAALLPLRRPA